MVLPTPELDVGWDFIVVLDDDGLALGASAGEVVAVRHRGPKGEAGELVEGCDPKYCVLVCGADSPPSPLSPSPRSSCCDVLDVSGFDGLADRMTDTRISTST